MKSERDIFAPKREQPDEKTKAFIDGLLAEGYNVTLFRDRNGRLYDARVTGKASKGKGKLDEVWCN